MAVEYSRGCFIEVVILKGYKLIEALLFNRPSGLSILYHMTTGSSLCSSPEALIGRPSGLTEAIFIYKANDPLVLCQA